MRKVSINFDNPQIEINGIVFDLKKSDIEIYQDVLKAKNTMESMDKQNNESILEACRKCATIIDEILGKGALMKLSGGHPVGINKQLEIMLTIATECGASYSDYLAENYLQADE